MDTTSRSKSYKQRWGHDKEESHVTHTNRNASTQARRRVALANLESQLKTGLRPVNSRDYITTLDKNGHIVHQGKPVKHDDKGELMFDKKADGTMVPVLLEVLPLTSEQIARKQAEIVSLKRKLQIA